MEGQALPLNMIIHKVGYVGLSTGRHIGKRHFSHIVHKVCKEAHSAVHANQEICMGRIGHIWEGLSSLYIVNGQF